MSSLIRATNLWGYDERVRRLGGDPLPLLARYHLPPEEQRDDHSFLVFKQMTALLEDTAEALGDPAFGLGLARYQGMDILGPISVIARSSLTVGEAINSIARYLHLHCPALAMAMSRTTLGEQPVIRFLYSIDQEGGGYPAQAYELSLANAMQVMKLLCGETFALLSVYFRHARQAGPDAYWQVFRCDVQFDAPWCGFYLPASVAAMPLPSADQRTWQLAQRYLEAQQAPNAPTLAEDVVRLIHSLLPTGQCSSETIATHLALNKRTLQRRLAREGTSYEQLLEEARRRLARQYLREPNLGFGQIGGLLGYSEQSAFNRACRGWFGQTPKQVRKALLG